MPKVLAGGILLMESRRLYWRIGGCEKKLHLSPETFLKLTIFGESIPYKIQKIIETQVWFFLTFSTEKPSFCLNCNL